VENLCSKSITLIFQVLQDSLNWLNRWETSLVKKDIALEEFLTKETSQGLRVSLINNYSLF
jgi:hypothetical protein